MSFVPRELVEEQAGFARFAGRCLLCTTVDAEENVGYRVVYSDEQVLVVCPFWSGSPYEMLVIPRAHGPHLHHSPTTDLLAVGRALKIALGRLRTVLGDIAYNLVFHSAPYRAPEPYHWHVHVVPKLTTVAGFELGHRRAHQHREPRAGRRGAGRTDAGGRDRLSRTSLRSSARRRRFRPARS